MWLVATHIYIAASLNYQVLSAAGGSGSTSPYVQAVVESLFSLRASLEFACHNISEWSLGGNMGSVVLLDGFNHGALPGVPACVDTTANVCTDNRCTALATYYYINGNDIVVMRDPSAPNATTVTSEMNAVYDRMYGLYTLVFVLVIVIVLLSVKLWLTMNDNHVYSLRKPPFPGDEVTRYQHRCWWCCCLGDSSSTYAMENDDVDVHGNTRSYEMTDVSGRTLNIQTEEIVHEDATIVVDDDDKESI
jgi:hypothetical protein